MQTLKEIRDDKTVVTVKEQPPCHHSGFTLGVLLINSHLAQIDNQATEMFELLVKQLAEREGVTEQLKAQDQMAWVQHMNAARNTAEEIVLSELIY